MPLSPASAAFHVLGASRPIGVTQPIPVTATRVIRETLRFPPMPAAAVPFPPMEAELVRELPDGDGWQYEPKWDGFRGVLENVGGELTLWSRNERPLLRYFPELRPLGELLPPHSALDGEIVIARDGRARLRRDADAPAPGRVADPAASRPRSRPSSSSSTCSLWEGEPVWRLPLAERRAARREAARASASRRRPATSRPREAWLDRFEALGLDGVIAKRLDSPYLPGSRDAVVKVKEHRTADCVVVGVRWKGEPQRRRDAAARSLPRRRRARLRRLVRRRAHGCATTS